MDGINLGADGVVLNAAELGLMTPDIEKVIQLKCGDLVRIYKGKGKHARIATRICGNNQELYMPALLSLLSEFRQGDNWSFLTMEDFDEMPLSDYSQLVSHFGESFM